ncbi:MAG: T9SS type A sorting domain-containing protein [Bacteroidales bacterium]
MKRTITFLIAGLFVLGIALQGVAQSVTHDEQSDVAKNTSGLQSAAKLPVTWTYYHDAKGGMLYDNGPLVNIPGSAGNPDTSRLQSVTLSMSTLGFGIQLTATTSNRIADDVTIADSAWAIDSIVFFTYQTGSSTVSTTTGSNLRIWDGAPDLLTSNIVWGDDITDRLANTYWSNIYRDSESATGIGNTTRPIMRNVLQTAGWFLNPGTYWLDYQAEGSLTSGPWGPPITINGLTVTGNALQMTSAGWAPANDGGSMTQQGLPFIIYGSKVVSSIEDHLAAQPVRMFPNPANGYVNLESHTLISKVEIANQIGQIVHSSNPEAVQCTIDLGSLTPGLYLITIQNGSNITTSKLMVK